ncbi:V-set and immunoglobulin domain-containing protein 4 [Octodon degus]|uniref:V-set and immunoglobulin domain-containing protein 4 n=1 Tax=Octodon degus TaxID=10160 RepID=UPI000C9EE274|nr:V-set and immunoglobulin domain-containing protein 4 [Octodon degus]
MGILLDLFLLSHLTVIACGHPILEAPENIKGPWKGNVTIPCTYGPLKDYTEVMVRWLVQRDSEPVTIFQRDSSGEHIQQAKYRGRLYMSQKIPGVVSLQLNTLEMDDRGHYTCEVTWNTPDHNQVMREKIIELYVQKSPVSKPTVTTDSSYGFTVPQGMRINLQCQAWGSPPISYVWYKEQTNDEKPIKVSALSTLVFKPAVVADSGSYFCTAKGRVGSEQRSDIVKFVVRDSLNAVDIQKGAPKITKAPLEATTTVNQSWEQTTKMNVYSGETIHGPRKGRNLPMYAIILITSLCCIVVITMVYVIFCRKTTQQEDGNELIRPVQ